MYQKTMNVLEKTTKDALKQHYVALSPYNNSCMVTCNKVNVLSQNVTSGSWSKLSI